MKRFAVFLTTMIMPAALAASPCVFASETTAETAETAEADAGSTEEATEDEASDEATESTGQPGDTVYAVSDMDSDRTVPVTFILDVPSDVSSPCVVSFVESESYIEYYVEAYRSASYTVTEYMAPGTYIITDGGPVDDYTSSYSVQDKSYFVVSEDGSSSDNTVNVTIRSRGDLLRGDTGTDSEEETATDTEAEEVTTEHSYTWLYVLAAIVCMLFGGVVTALGLKYLGSQDM